MWIITNDLINDRGPVEIKSADFDSSRRQDLNFRFRLHDADGEVYYEGFSSDANSESAFAPLDDFGQSHAGCVSIDYYDGTVWREL